MNIWEVKKAILERERKTEGGTSFVDVADLNLSSEVMEHLKSFLKGKTVPVVPHVPLACFPWDLWEWVSIYENL